MSFLLLMACVTSSNLIILYLFILLFSIFNYWDKDATYAENWLATSNRSNLGTMMTCHFLESSHLGQAITSSHVQNPHHNSTSHSNRSYKLTCFEAIIRSWRTTNTHDIVLTRGISAHSDGQHHIPLLCSSAKPTHMTPFVP